MENNRHKTFISFYHEDLKYKEELVKLYGGLYFVDKSVGDGEISDCLTDDQIRRKIRDEYLEDSTVTVLLCGNQTKNRKHIDWELYSTMYDGPINKKGGVLVVLLPEIRNCNHYVPSNFKDIYPPGNFSEINRSIDSINALYAPLPKRIKDQLVSGTAEIAIISWEEFVRNVPGYIDRSFNNKESNKYSLTDPMRRNNS